MKQTQKNDLLKIIFKDVRYLYCKELHREKVCFTELSPFGEIRQLIRYITDLLLRSHSNHLRSRALKKHKKEITACFG